jgi:hypothetical protein
MTAALRAKEFDRLQHAKRALKPLAVEVELDLKAANFKVHSPFE